MDVEVGLRSLQAALFAFNQRVQKVERVKEKLKGKELITLRNALKLYQNYKALETTLGTLLVSINNLSVRLSSDGGLIIGRVGDDYLVLQSIDNDRFVDYPVTSMSRTYTPDQVVLFHRVGPNSTSTPEYRPKHAVLALYPNTNKMLPAQVSSPPSRRRKTNDYLVKFPADPQSVPCPLRFVIDPNDVVL